MKHTISTSCTTALCLFCLSCSASAQSVGSQLKGADANQDGSITRQEIITFREKRFPSLDRNEDGFLSADDIPAIAAVTRRGADFEALIKEFDTNSDGGVSQEEFVNGPTVLFDRADSNDDGVLSPSELRADAKALLD